MRNHLSEVPNQACAVVDLCVCVEDLLPDTLRGQPDLVVWARLCGEVGDTGDHLTIAVIADPGKDVAAMIIGVDPGETGCVRVTLPQGGVLLVERVEVLDQPLD